MKLRNYEKIVKKYEDSSRTRKFVKRTGKFQNILTRNFQENCEET